MTNLDELKDKVQKAYSEWERIVLLNSIDENSDKKHISNIYAKSLEFDSSLQNKSLYTPLDINEEKYLDEIGFPGVYPFTRGIRATMYEGKLWTMRQYAGFGTALETNKRFKYLLSNGTSGLSTAFDLPTQIGYDSDDPISYGEVGKVGVAIDTLAALKEAVKGHENIMPKIVDAVKTYASVGEICNTMREVFGEHRETINI
jgi:methylmalonyl-CoA mutase N-terminal domain/subunit